MEKEGCRRIILYGRVSRGCINERVGAARDVATHESRIRRVSVGRDRVRGRQFCVGRTPFDHMARCSQEIGKPPRIRMMRMFRGVSSDRPD